MKAITQWRLKVLLTGLAYPFALGLLAWRCEPFRKVLHDYVNLFVMAGTAYLAYCYAQRQAFLTALRELWDRCIETKADLIDYMRHSPANAVDP